jgi:HK97 family phage major capsid protein
VNSADTVPVSFYDRLFMIAKKVGPWLDVADVIVRNSGNDLRIPIMSAYSTISATTAGSAIAQSEPTFTSLLLSPVKGAALALIANELLDDAGFDIAGSIAEQFGVALGTYVNGTATSTVVGAAGSGVALGTSVLTGDGLIDLAYSIDGGYRPQAGYMAAGSTIGAIRKLKDSAGNYLYSVGQGVPDTFAGFPIYENPSMSAVGSGVKSVLFGDFKAVKVTHTPVSVATSADAYFDQDVTAYRASLRFAAGLASSGAVKYLTTS